MSYLLSVCIPTRNRQRYCAEVLSILSRFKNANLEVCVMDNSDTDELASIVSNLRDQRVRYCYDASVKSSSRNMSDCLAMAEGDFVCMIGDDDLILPQIFDLCDFMWETDSLAGVGSHIPEYIWFDSENRRSCELKIVPPRKCPKDFEIFATGISVVETLLRQGVVGYQEFRLPRVYHGVVRRSLIETILLDGTYFFGLSPDIFSSVGMAFSVDKLVVSEDPISVAGACPSSTTIAMYKNEHSGAYTDIPHLIGRENYPWRPEVPRIYSVPTIWADSALQAVVAFGPTKLSSEFNVTDHLCDLISSFPQARACLADSEAWSQLIAPSWLRVWVWWSKRIWNRLVRKLLYTQRATIIHCESMKTVLSVFE